MQMTKLSHRVSLLEDQQFLIIHATADGEDRATPRPLVLKVPWVVI